jgi:2-aminomuconate deaminase
MEDKILQNRAKPLGKYPFVKRAGDFVFISGTSARLPDNSIAGASVSADGVVIFDVRTQTRAVIENIRGTLKSVAADLKDCVEIISFLVDMKDFADYNDVYGEYFSADGPARTTVGVYQLPHPHMRIEMKVVAYLPTQSR